jgi:hypothetical protein
MGTENTPSQSESGVAGGSPGYRLATFLLGLVELVFGAYALYAGVRTSRGIVVGLGVAVLGLGVAHSVLYRPQKSPPKTSG